MLPASHLPTLLAYCTPLHNIRYGIDFDEQLNAVGIAWLDIAWTKYCMRKHIDLGAVIDFNSWFETEVEKRIPGFRDCKSLADAYGNAFGSSFTDGNTVMAGIFVRNILKDFDQKIAERYPEEMSQAILVFSNQFVDMFDSSMAGLKSHGVIR